MFIVGNKVKAGCWENIRASRRRICFRATSNTTWTSAASMPACWKTGSRPRARRFYAFDADGNTGTNGGVIWHVSLGTSAATPNNDFGNRYGPYHDIDPEVGITSTPVIDLASGTIYVDAFTHEGSSYFHRIHALDIATGAEKSFSPVLVTASVPGIGVGSSNGVCEFRSVV
jgi:hypothetical protein